MCVLAGVRAGRLADEGLVGLVGGGARVDTVGVLPLHARPRIVDDRLRAETQRTNATGEVHDAPAAGLRAQAMRCACSTCAIRRGAGIGCASLGDWRKYHPLWRPTIAGGYCMLIRLMLQWMCGHAASEESASQIASDASRRNGVSAARRYAHACGRIPCKTSPARTPVATAAVATAIPADAETGGISISLICSKAQRCAAPLLQPRGRMRPDSNADPRRVAPPAPPCVVARCQLCWNRRVPPCTAPSAALSDVALRRRGCRV
eukprot:5287834-Pleurochrysis_carterae.AAC.3